MPERATIHASAVLVGAKAVLIRGPSGSGKSKLAWDLIEAGSRGAIPFARLIGDDRVYVEVSGDRLLVRPAEKLAGLLEVRGLGIRGLPFEPVAVIGLIVDLAADDAARMPELATVTIDGVRLPRLAVAGSASPLPMVLARLGTSPKSG